jgi:hypothetical protein
MQVCSANTDGIVVKCKKELEPKLKEVFEYWENQTGFKTEETQYRAIYSKDVNNYLAVKVDGKIKAKGLYSNPWINKGEEIFRFHKNPTNTICSEAACKFLSQGIPIEETITKSRDISKFVTVRSVTGGAVKDGVYLGKVIRWYYATGQTSEIIYAKNGYKVPKSEGVKPLMELGTGFPEDIDFERYIAETNELLKDICAL